MAFTNIWDNTQPPDSQAANQLGNDLRTLRTDVQQRMSAISGTDANRLTISFEPSFNGVLYFATDTGKIYEWGGAWNQIGTFNTSILGQLVIQNGSQVAPGLIFSNSSTATGLFNSAPDTLGFSIAGVMKMAMLAAQTSFFQPLLIDPSVPVLPQTDNSGTVATTAWLTDQGQTNKQSSFGVGKGFVSFPKWLTGGVHQLLVKWDTIDSTPSALAIVFDPTVPFTAAPAVTMMTNASNAYIDTPGITPTGFTAQNVGGKRLTYIALGYAS